MSYQADTVPSTPSPPSSPFPSVAPPTTTHLTFAQRVQNSTCFKCQNKGHWAKDCPLKTPTKKPDPPTNSSLYPHTSTDRCFKCHKTGHWAINCPLNTPTKKPDSPTNSSLYPDTSTDRCFKCHNIGHWAINCPLNTPNKPDPPPSTIACDYLLIQCRCGAGPCDILFCKSSLRNYYACPGISEDSCRYHRWCDEVTVNEINYSPNSRYPKCGCGAGTCTISTERSGPDAGRSYFVCPIPKGQGACGFFQWQDAPVKSTTSGLEVESSFSDTQSSLNRHTEPTITNNNSGRESDLSFKRKRFEFESSPVRNFQQCLNFVALSGPIEKDKELLIESKEHNGNFASKHYNPSQDGSLENDSNLTSSGTKDLVLPEAKSLGFMVEQAFQACILTSGAEIHWQQLEFWRQISIAGAIHFKSLHFLGWLGRLAFPPSRCLTFSPSKPFFCCVFPSFDPIFVPQDFDNEGSPSDTKFDGSKRLSLCTPFQSDHPASGVLWEPSCLQSPPKLVQGNIMTESILKVFGQAAMHVQNELLTLLESMDPCNHETMVREANAAFVALDHLSVDYSSFYSRVREFITRASSLVQIEWSISNDISSQKLVDRYNCEKLHFDDLSRIHVEAIAELKTSNERLQILREEASRVKNMLSQIESQLSSCEIENVDLRTRVVQLSEEMMESQNSLEIASEESKEALKLCRERKAEQSAAKAALERAKIQLRQ